MNPRGTPENLRPPWRKGESGNPGGRRRTPPFTRALEKIIRMKAREVMKFNPADTIPMAVVKRMFFNAINGDSRLGIELAERVDGTARHGAGVAVRPDSVHEANVASTLRDELAVRYARVWIERDLAYKLPLPKFAQEAVREMDPETVAEAERAGLLEPLKTPGTPREGEEPQRGPVGGADPKPEEEK